MRGGERLWVRAPRRKLRAGDILILEAEAETLARTLSSLGLELEEAARKESEEDAEGEESAAREQDAPAKEDAPPSGESAEDLELLELVVLPGSRLAGRSATDLLLRTQYGINLLAVSRRGKRSIQRLRALRLAAGDLLLLQGPPEVVPRFASETGCVPLAKRELSIPDGRAALLATGVLLAAIASAALGLLPAAVSFAAGVLASLALRTVPPRAAYDAIDWPVVVLLAALIPVAGAMESTGAASVVASFLLEDVAQGGGVLALATVLVLTMFLSDLMNNAATAAVMSPIALGAAGALGANPDCFLMAVAVGASCAFLTPIGHQNNTLILGPGGFRFGDYWRMGLALEAVIVAIGLPVLLIAWPLWAV